MCDIFSNILATKKIRKKQTHQKIFFKQGLFFYIEIGPVLRIGRSSSGRSLIAVSAEFGHNAELANKEIFFSLKELTILISLMRPLTVPKNDEFVFMDILLYCNNRRVA